MATVETSSVMMVAPLVVLACVLALGYLWSLQLSRQDLLALEQLWAYRDSLLRQQHKERLATWRLPEPYSPRNCPATKQALLLRLRQHNRGRDMARRAVLGIH